MLGFLRQQIQLMANYKKVFIITTTTSTTTTTTTTIDTYAWKSMQ